MQLGIHWISVPTVFGIILATSSLALSDTLTIAPNFQPDPITITGNSGGTVPTDDCGFIAKTPNQVLEVTKNISFLRFTVQSKANVTLLIEGPKGRFCILEDGSGGKIEFPGYGDQGTYSIYIGDRQGQHPFTLSISQKSN